MPLISICIPAYKAERYLEAALQSVKAQTFADWELIVTEDGSKDRAEEMVRAFAATVAQPVTYQRHEVNQGLPTTRNTGIASARGEFIALLDSDDYWAPHHLEKLVATQRAQNADLVHSGSILFDSDTGATLEHRRPSADQIAQFPVSLYAGTYIIQPSSVMVRKAVFARIGVYDTSFRYCEDLELWFRAAKNGVRFAFSGEDSCHYRKHASALSNQGAPMSIAAARAYSKHFDWPALNLTFRRARTAGLCEAAGRIHLRSDPGRAWGFFERAWQFRRNPKYLLFAWLAAIQAKRSGQALQPFAA
jgi:glycosyltransferase involved in cell wall biosynthesis